MSFSDFFRELFLKGARIDRQTPELAPLRNRFIFEADDKMHQELLEDSVRKELKSIARRYLKFCAGIALKGLTNSGNYSDKKGLVIQSSPLC
jgi:hypothetical protein